MAGVMALVIDATSVGLEPTYDYRKIDILGVSRHRSLSGKAYTYLWFDRKRKWEIPLDFVPSSIATLINSAWYTAVSTCKFYEDAINYANSFYYVNIVNAEIPLSKIQRPYWETRYNGILILEEK